MCFDVGIAVCGPNEALVISGMCYVSIAANHGDGGEHDGVAGQRTEVHSGRESPGVPLCADHPEAASQHHDARGQDHQGLYSPGRYYLQYIYSIYNSQVDNI